jgi:Flp pilus assembly protein TadG
MHRLFNHLRSVRRGASAVEFAIVAPLFMLVLAGIIEFGQAFRVQHAISAAARRGTRLAVIDDSTSSTVQSRIQSDCTRSLGVSATDVTVQILVNGVAGQVENAQTGDELSVKVSIPFSKVGVGFYANLFKDKTLSATCIMEHE